MNPKLLFLAFFAIAFVLRLALAWATDYLSVMNFTEMMFVAVNFAETGEFSNPYGVVTGPTAHSTPVFPMILAAVVAWLGKTETAQIVISVLTCLLSALRCGLVPLLALEAGLGLRAAIAAGLLGLGYVGALETEVRGGVDGPYVALCLLGIVWMSLRLWRSESWRTRTPWAFFAMCEFSILLNPSLIPVVAGIALVGLLGCRPGDRVRYAKQTVWLGLVVFAFLLPWGLRNLQKLGAFVPTRSNLGLELWLSNGHDRTYDLPYNYGTYHPLANRQESQQVAQLGEVTYNAAKRADAMAWIRTNPAPFARLTGRRLLAWWFPPGPLLLAVAKGVLTLAAFGGLSLMWRTNRTLFALILTTWLTFPLIYYVIQWTSRMRYPMDWQLVLCAGVALAALMDLMHGPAEEAK